MSSWMRVVSLAVLAIVFLTGGARADDPPIGKPRSASALERLSLGNKLYNVRSFEEAAAEYKAGALVEAAPIWDYNLGQCYRQLGKYKDAIWHYQRFLKASPETKRHVESVQKLIEQMQAELDSKAMSQPPTEPASVSPEPTPTPSPRVESTPTTSSDVAPWYTDRLGLGFSVAGVVGLGVGTGFLISSRGLNDDANTAATQAERNALYDKAETRATISTVAMIGGGALLVAGVIMLAIPNKRASSQAHALGVGVAADGVLVYGRF